MPSDCYIFIYFVYDVYPVASVLFLSYIFKKYIQVNLNF